MLKDKIIEENIIKVLDGLNRSEAKRKKSKDPKKDNSPVGSPSTRKKVKDAESAM